MSKFAAEEDITIAVMGCRVNGPGETDDADLGLWCAPKHVNLKRKGEYLGAFPYDQILARLQDELQQLLGVPVDLVTPRDLPAHFRDIVVAEAQPV